MRKVSRGADFDGVVRYSLSSNEERRAEPGRLIGGSFGSAMKPGAIIKQLEGISAIKKTTIKKPVWHNSLRLPKGEKVGEEKWVEIGDEYMRRMGFTEAHPRIYVLHDDFEGQHIHIVASRVAADGTVFHGQNENLISTRVIAALEKEFALTITKSVELDKDDRIVMPDVKQLRKSEIEKAVRTNQKPPRLVLQEAVETALVGRPTTKRFIERLEAVGVTVSTNFKDDRFNGFGFGYGGAHFSASDLGDKYKFSRLQKRLNYDQARDHPELSKRRRERVNNTGRAERDVGSAAKDGGGPRSSHPPNRKGDGEAGADNGDDDDADRADQPPAPRDREEPAFEEAAAFVKKVSKPARDRWRAIAAEEKAERERRQADEKAQIDREKREAEEERDRQDRVRQVIARRQIACRIVNADRSNGWRAWRSKMLMKEYGSASDLLTLFFITRNPPKREIIYEYAGAKIIDKGPMITASKGSYAEIEAMLELARIKGWKSIKFQGSDEFKREAMRLALISGFKVSADDPKDAAILKDVRDDLAPVHASSPSLIPAPAPRPSGFQ